jgi:hypothetical protein
MVLRARNVPSDNKSKFAMVRPPKNVPSDEKKQVCDGTPAEKRAVG